MAPRLTGSEMDWARRPAKPLGTKRGSSMEAWPCSPAELTAQRAPYGGGGLLLISPEAGCISSLGRKRQQEGVWQRGD